MNFENITNKKLLAALVVGNLKVAEQIADKLYKKARETNDLAQELALANVLEFCKGEAITDYSEKLTQYKKEKDYLDRRKAVQLTPKYLTEKDSLKRFDMKESA